MQFLLSWLEATLLATIPAVGFALLFNVPPRVLRYCAAGGALGYGSRFLLLHLGVPIEWATLVAAVLIGAAGARWAKKMLAHPKVVTVAAVIPMVPGVYAFRGMIALVEIKHRGFSEALWARAVDNLMEMSFLVVALTLGLATPGLLLYRRKPVI